MQPLSPSLSHLRSKWFLLQKLFELFWAGEARSYSVKRRTTALKKLTNKKKKCRKHQRPYSQVLLKLSRVAYVWIHLEILLKCRLWFSRPEKSPWFYISNKIPLRQQYCAPSQDLTSRMKEPEHRSRPALSHITHKEHPQVLRGFWSTPKELQVPKTGR